MNEPSRGELHAFLGHLGTLLTLADLDRELTPRRAPLPVEGLLRLARAAAGALEVAIFRVHGLDSEDTDDEGTASLSVVRLGAIAGAEAAFDPTRVDLPPSAHAMLLSCLMTGASEAVGPVELDASIGEPRFLAFVPISHDGAGLGVLRAARREQPFSDSELSLLEAAASTAVSALFLAEREDTVAELLVALIAPSGDGAGGDRDRDRVRLRSRVRRFLEHRRALPESRTALVVAASIAELAAHSSRSLSLAEDVLEAIHRSLDGTTNTRRGDLR